MSEPPGPEEADRRPEQRLAGKGGPPAEEERRSVVDALCDHFAGDRLELAEFERRVDRANRVTTRGELHALIADLPGPGGEGTPSAQVAPTRREPTGEGAGGLPARSGRSLPPARTEEVRDRGIEVAVWSGRVRKGGWVPPRNLTVLAFMGGIELDFREARFAPGVYDLRAVAFMGGIEILVPPGLRVETDGMAIMGAFEDESEYPERPDPGAPLLRIGGFAFMGGVDVEVRRPGESARDARRRRKRGEPAGELGPGAGGEGGRRSRRGDQPGPRGRGGGG